MDLAAKFNQPAPVGASRNVRIRSATLSDLTALVTLEQLSFDGDRMTRAQYRRHLDSESAEVLVAVQSDQGDETRGSAVVFFRRRSNVARLYSLAVMPQARGAGIGVALVHSAVALAERRGCHALRLEVRCDNGPAITLYERGGFRPIGRRIAYYEDGADALRYELCLRRKR